MSKLKLTYTEAVAELETILAELENNSEINMDLISEKVKRAAVLMDGRPDGSLFVAMSVVLASAWAPP